MILRRIYCGYRALALHKVYSRSTPSFCLTCHGFPSSSHATLREEVSRWPGQLPYNWWPPNRPAWLVKGNKLSHQTWPTFLLPPVRSLWGSSPSWLICFPQSNVSGEARMLSDVSNGGDHFSNFHVSCHFFHSERIILKSNLPWKSLVIPSMCPKPDIWAGWPAHHYITSDFLINSFNLNCFRKKFKASKALYS